MSAHQAFWDDLQQDLKDPEFAREYVEATLIVHALDELPARTMSSSSRHTADPAGQPRRPSHAVGT